MAQSATDAILLVDNVRNLFLAGDAILRAILLAHHTPRTLFRIDHIFYQCLALFRGAFFIVNMCFVLIPEIPDGGKHGIGRRLAKPAQGRGYDIAGQRFKDLYIAHPAFPLGNIGQLFQQYRGPFPAGGTFAA
jgi:hypothetical protein